MEKNIYAFVRSRTYYREYDYRLLTPLSKISKITHQYFEKCVRNILSDSSKNETEWDEPTWLLIKQDKCILWGVACNNRIFSKDCSEEEVGRRGVRCFCGVVYVEADVNSLKLPYSVQAFQPIFDCTIGALWKERISEKQDVIVSLGETNEYIESAVWKNELNVSSHICRLLPSSSDTKALLSACLTASTDISIAVNVMTQEQVYDKKTFIALLNAVMRHGNSTIDIPIKQKCKKCGTWVDDLNDGLCDDCRKREDSAQSEELIQDATPDVLYTCVRCGKQTDWTNEKGLCIECIERQKRRQQIRYIIIGVLLMFIFIVKMCASCHNNNHIVSHIASIDSCSHKMDTIDYSSPK